MLRTWLKQAVPLVAILVVALVIFSLGVKLAAYVAVVAFLALAILLANRGPL